MVYTGSMRNTDLRSKAASRNHEDRYSEAIARLKQAELAARQEKDLIRLHRKRQRRIWLQKLRLPALVILGAALMAMIAIWAGAKLLAHKSSGGSSTSPHSAAATADFKPVLPQNLKQPVTTAQNNHSTIVTFSDSYANANLTLSQQKLPDSFKSDPQAITKLDQFKLATALDTSKGKLYITTNASGQQWAAIVLGDVLVFINASKTLDSVTWQKYLSSLKPR